MKLSLKRAWSAIVAAGIYLSAINVQAAQYALIELGGFPISDPGAEIIAVDINENNQIIVQAEGRGFLWEDGAVTELRSLSQGQQTSVEGINDNGAVVGGSWTTNGPRALAWQAGAVANLGTFSGGTTSWAYGANNLGDIVGYSNSSEFAMPHAVLWRAGLMTDLGTPGNYASSFAMDINDRGQIVGVAADGSGGTVALLWNSGVMINLGSLGGHESYPEAINASGEIVGWSVMSSGLRRAFRHSNGFLESLGNLRGAGGESMALDVNDKGDIVGWSQTAVLWKNGQAVNLNDQIPIGSVLNLQQARAINNAGYIVGWGLTKQGYRRPFLLVPSGPQNQVPIANAGPDRSAGLGTVLLDGGGSYDADNNVPLTYAWSFVSKPAGSLAVLSSMAASTPNFVADRLGIYLLSLVVTDSLGASSTADQVVITVINTPPVANAGADLTAYLNNTVMLDGSESYDSDGNTPLSYAWSLVSKPGGSVAALSNAQAVKPTLTIDKPGSYILYLVVTDALGAASAVDQVIINTVNATPVARAGADQAVHVGLTAQLDGGLSSDADGDTPLAYAWFIVSKPAGSAAVLSSAQSVSASFVPDIVGTYVLSLIVTDQLGASSAADQIVINASNATPIAQAGPDKSVHIGATAVLDGSGSTDGDGDYPLSYAWVLESRPMSSASTLTNAHAVNASLTVDKAGDYVVSLVVTDKLGAVSVADTLVISTTNVAPVANAGTDQAIMRVNGTVQLDGTASYDPDGDPIQFLWTFDSMPASSAAQFNDKTSPQPRFVADTHGDYIVRLTVTDMYGLTGIATVSVSFNNIKPVASIAAISSAAAGEMVFLDGTASSDANGDTLSYAWSLVTAPAGSTSAITNPDLASALFVPDVAGIYVISLVVNDGFVKSDPSNITLTVVTAQEAAIYQVHQLMDTLNSIDFTAFVNKNSAKTLTNKLNAVLTDIQNGDYQLARDKLFTDILNKTNGCAASGVPDSNDWINTCTAQESVYALVVGLINRLTVMTP